MPIKPRTKYCPHCVREIGLLVRVCPFCKSEIRDNPAVLKGSIEDYWIRTRTGPCTPEARTREAAVLETVSETAAGKAQERNDVAASGHRRRGSQSKNIGRERPTTTTEHRFDNWAVAVEHWGGWHVFKKHSSEWRHFGKVSPEFSSGDETKIMETLAFNGGWLGKFEAVKLFRRHPSDEDVRMLFTRKIKPVVSRLRKKLRKSLNIQNKDPIPWDDKAKGYHAKIQIGYAIKDEKDRLRFKLRHELTGDECLDH